MPSQETHLLAGSADLGSVYIPATSQCSAGVLGVEADLERLWYSVASAISRSNHNLSCGTCNIPLTTRRDKAQYNAKRHAGWQLTPSICQMKVECRGAIANARGPKASKILAHFFHCCSSMPSRSSIKSTTANSSWFAPTMCGRSHKGSNLRQRYSRVVAINNKRSTKIEIAQNIYLCHNQGWCERHIIGRRFQIAVRPRCNQLLLALWTGT